jgi:hypothetical protein
MTFGIHNWAEIIAAATCTICFYAKPSVTNRWFCWFLWLTVLIELTGKLTVNLPHIKLPMYNLFICLQMFFFSVYFNKIRPSAGRKKIIQSCFFAFFIFFWINFILVQKPLIYNTYSSNLRAVLVSLFCLLYYFDLVIAAHDDHNKGSRLLIVSGIFIFYTGGLKIYSSFNVLAQKMPAQLFWLYNSIISNLNVLLYGLFALGFVKEVIENRKHNNGTFFEK